MSEITEKLLDSLRALANSAIEAAPRVLLGLLMILAAVLVAKVVEKVLRMLLVRIKFDALIQKARVDGTLQKMGIRRELDRLIPRLVYFLLLLLFARTAADALGLQAISDAMGAFFSYLPNIIAALLLLVLGTAGGSFAGQTITNAGKASGLDFAPALGRFVAGMIFFIVGMMALGQLRIDTEIIRLVTSFCLAGMALAFGLSFGLGAREVTRNILAGFYARRILRVGKPLEIAGQSGILKAVTPTHALIESGEQTIAVSNGAFLDEVARQ